MEYKNRYGSIHTFKKMNDNCIKWEGDFSFGRVGFDPNVNKDIITFYDPSGGPFISLDTDLTGYGFYEPFVVGRIEQTKDNAILLYKKSEN